MSRKMIYSLAIVCLNFITILLLVVSSGTVQDASGYTCQKHLPCNSTDAIVEAIISDGGNHQRLIEAFFPINHAKPQFLLFIIFANGTSINKEVCIDRESYVGMVFELNGLENVYGTMWYSSTTNTVLTTVLISEMALLIPQGVLGRFFKENPIITDYSVVCLTLPYLKSPDKSDSQINDVFLPVVLVVSLNH